MTSITFTSGIGYSKGGNQSCGSCNSSCNSDTQGCSQPYGPSFPNMALPGTQRWSVTPMSSVQKIQYIRGVKYGARASASQEASQWHAPWGRGDQGATQGVSQSNPLGYHDGGPNTGNYPDTNVNVDSAGVW